MTELVRYKHLLNLPFEHGKQDCYTMAQRMFRDNPPNVILSDYARPDDWWIKEGMDLYDENFSHEGFFDITDLSLKELQPMDTFMIAIPDSRYLKKTRTNHCAIYLGDNLVIHHPFGRRSLAEPYKHSLRTFTVRVIRHKDAPRFEKPTSKIDIMDYLLPSKRKLLEDALQRGTKT